MHDEWRDKYAALLALWSNTSGACRACDPCPNSRGGTSDKCLSQPLCMDTYVSDLVAAANKHYYMHDVSVLRRACSTHINPLGTCAALDNLEGLARRADEV